MKCPKCEHENREGAKFCGKCKTKLAHICPHCGSENPPENDFCDQCGNNFESAPTAGKIDFEKPQSYTPKPLAQKILTQRKQLEGERKLVTVFFSDVKGSTALHEKLDPEVMTGIIEGWYQIVMDEIHRYEGTITQFMGDGVMALFGAPLAHEDHARRACLAGLAIQERVREYAAKVNPRHGIDFKTRIGLNSGLVIVTSVGDDLKMDYTALGDTVNLASRMETSAQPGSVLVSENTYKLAKDYFVFKSIGEIQVKGKSQPQPAYEVERVSDVSTRLEASVVRGLTKFVGRRKEIDDLVGAFNKAKSGSGQVVGVIGEPGVGKSRLLYEFKNLLSPDEYQFLEGHCLQYGGTVIYMPVLDILRSWFEIKEGESETTVKEKLSKKLLALDDKLSGTIPALQDLLSLTVDDKDYQKLEVKAKRERVFESVRNLLIRLGQERPLIIAIEDLHWMDKSSEEFLDFLIASLANTNILLILLYRPEYAHQWGSKTYYHRINLDQLNLSEAAELVLSILEDGEVAPELRELILKRAAGNPLFMEELTHTLLENGSIKKEGDKFILTRSAKDIEVPDTVQGIIAARMDRLEDQLKKTLQVAAVIGRDFAFRILHAITEMREELKTHLGKLQGLEFIYQKQLFPELEYIFKHALTQEVAYSSLLVQRRKEIHEKIGRAIEEIYSDRLEEFCEVLAYHFTRAENWEKAYQYFKMAGEKARTAYSNFESYRFFKEALQALTRMPETDENIKGQREIYEMMSIPMALALPDDTLAILHEEESLLTRIGDSRALIKFYSKMTVHYNSIGKPVQGIKYSEKAYQEARKLKDFDLMAPLVFSLGYAYNGTGEFYKIVEISAEFITLMENAKREYDLNYVGINMYSIGCSTYGNALGVTGNFRKAALFLEKGLKVAKEINSAFDLSMVENAYGWTFCDKGDGHNAIRHFQGCLAHLEKVQFLQQIGISKTGLGYGYFLIGDNKTAKEHMDMAVDVTKRLNNNFYIHCISTFSTYNEIASGNLDQAMSSAQIALEFSRKYESIYYEGHSLMLLGRVIGKRDPSQSQTAEDHIRQGMKIITELKLKPYIAMGYFFLGELFAANKRKELARENLDKALSMMDEMEMVYWPDRVREVLEKL